LISRLNAASQTATKGTRDYGVRLIEAGRTNLNAAFDYATELLSAKSPSEAIERFTAQLSKQLETAVGAIEGTGNAWLRRLQPETAEPIREGVNKAIRQRPDTMGSFLFLQRAALRRCIRNEEMTAIDFRQAAA
jgi:hypothetical protein